MSKNIHTADSMETVFSSKKQPARYAQNLKPEQGAHDGGAGRDRTDDLKLAKLPLSQLSYSPDRAKQMVGLVRFELTTSRLSSARSNQLSYKPALKSFVVVS